MPVHDEEMMRAALDLARRALGSVWPNPAVGCILTANPSSPFTRPRIIGRGFTQAGGRPHAETMALQAARGETDGATAYVTLEPCAHYGVTAPCASALIKAGIRRVVAPLSDPDPRVSGKGFARLKAAGIEVSAGLLAEEARAINAGFFLRIRERRPYVALKIATSLDGRIALANGDSQWITGSEARAFGHLLRSQFDAILTGAATVLQDNPQLNVRLPGLEGRSPLRVILDPKGRVPPSARLMEDCHSSPVWIITGPGASQSRLASLQERGVICLECPLEPDGGLNLAIAFSRLAEQGLTRLLVEGGHRLTTALLQRQQWDCLYWFRAPRLLGSDALPAVGALRLESLANSPYLRQVEERKLGPDTLTIFHPVGS